MVFSSYEFIFYFLPLVYIFFLASRRYAGLKLTMAFLIIASLVFYAVWDPRNLVLLVGSLAGNYVLGLLLIRCRRSGRSTTGILTFGCIANLCVLGYFKYAGFVVTNLNEVSASQLAVPDIVLPLAISFLTFQKIAYLVDTARGIVAETDPLRYCLFLTFFPQLIAGPIVHHHDIADQFIGPQAFRPRGDQLVQGTQLFIIGLAKKVLIADTLSPQADIVFSAPAAGLAISFFEAWVGALAYTFQLYFDFSGYSDMALGLGLLFGLRLPINFASPYKATSIVEFWRSWHISLSNFLRDYVYFSLGGSRRGRVRRYLNLVVTMTLGGLWHGAGWTFVVWGLFHGVALSVCHVWQRLPVAWGREPSNGSTGRWMGRILTFVAVVFGWVLFRAGSLGDAGTIMSSMIGLQGFDAASGLVVGRFGIISMIVSLFFVVWLMPNSLELVDYGNLGARRKTAWTWLGPLTRSPVYAAGMATIFVFTLSQMSTVNVFLYFQF
ncbi:MBOAT family O-acyltransferase [Marinivivus vitaminiproducens]|uniref:MBOAT family O-acyltransferase n=1 Tax=Marinivivus vitaminiproducens TaxID=3035935 RepID=UPI002799C8A2|nr:MBOAT family O-acyltransferase [Geminicoccaceae bacterium SCSIO 64248]